jgi:hypothetical protein
MKNIILLTTLCLSLTTDAVFAQNYGDVARLLLPTEPEKNRKTEAGSSAIEISTSKIEAEETFYTEISRSLKRWAFTARRMELRKMSLLLGL